MDLKTNIAGIELEHPLMNAAGTCKLLDGPEGVRVLARSATSAIVVGSITLEKRDGNSGDVYAFDSHRGFSLNSLGLPNPGAAYYKKHLPEMAHIAHDAGKPLIVSVAGFAPSEFGKLVWLALEGGADVVEVNIGCPNVWNDGKQKRIPSFHPEMVEEIAYQIHRDVTPQALVTFKISPFSDPDGLAALAKVLGNEKLVKAVTSTNTFPNAFAFAGADRVRPRITVGEEMRAGLAGMAGPALKPIGLGQVRQLRAIEAMRRVQLIGVGGIVTGDDVRDYLAAGASCVQIATTLLQEGPRAFSRILEELTADPPPCPNSAY